MEAARWMRCRSVRSKNRVSWRRPFPGLLSVLRDLTHYTPARLTADECKARNQTLQIDARNAMSQALLARAAWIGRNRAPGAAPGIDVETAATRVARMDIQAARRAA